MPVAGFASKGGREGHGRNGLDNRGTIACITCLSNTSYRASVSLKSDTDLVLLLFKVAEAVGVAERGTDNSKQLSPLIDTGFLGPDKNYIQAETIKAFATQKE